MKHNPLIYIMYDSIHNSIFTSQILNQLITLKQQNPEREIILISFESSPPAPDTITQLIPESASIITYFPRKLPLVHFINLPIAAWQIAAILNQHEQYELYARGPIAGIIGLYAQKKKQCLHFTIQVRGLLAAEYAYIHEENLHFFQKKWHTWRTKLYDTIERFAYSKEVINKHAHILLEAVSPALKKYVMMEYGIAADLITIAAENLLELTHTDKQQWRSTRRKELIIPENAYVYCYNGSAHAWQCPEETIVFFSKQYTKSTNHYLLIVTQEKKPFNELLNKYKIPCSAYRIITVAHQDVSSYLAASDAGILFRKNHIINWVSRPTKALEYRTAGLSIIHNKTVAYLLSQEEMV